MARNAPTPETGRILSCPGDPMTPPTIAALAARLHGARAQGTIVNAGDDLPVGIDDAYAVQAEIVRLGGDAIAAWKVTALRPQDQPGYGADRPVASPLMARFVHESPAALSLRDFITPMLECEFALRLARDLPARAEPYTREEIAAAIDAVVPAFEIGDGRVPADAPGALRLADSMGNGAFIIGAPVAWTGQDLSAAQVMLTLDGLAAGLGEGSRIWGGPLGAVQALANAQPLSAPLLAGQIVTTGSATVPLAVTHPVEAVADFGPLGIIRLRLGA